jgi:hypothetical protein
VSVRTARVLWGDGVVVSLSQVAGSFTLRAVCESQEN